MKLKNCLKEWMENFSERIKSFGKRGVSDKKARLLCVLLGMAMGAGIGFLFFRTLIPVTLGGVCGAILFPIARKKEREEKARTALESDCAEMLRAFSVALRAGKSTANAMMSAAGDCSLGDESVLLQRWKRMCGKVKAGRIPEEAFAEMAQECRLQELTHLSEVMMICRENGGNLSDTVSETVAVLRDRQKVRGELAILIARKKNEQKVLNVMPFALLASMSLVAGSYMEPLYETAQGRLVMFLCLLTMAGSVLMSKEITRRCLE